MKSAGTSSAGVLAARASNDLIVSINSNANNLGPGIHTAFVEFVNVSNGQGTTDRQVWIDVKCPGSLVVTPSTPFVTNGVVGGPFSPFARTYTLTNPLTDVGGTLCGSEIEFVVTTTAGFVSISPTSGTLGADETTDVTIAVSGNANSLSSGTFNGSVSFVNSTNHLGDTDRGVSLVIATDDDPTPSEGSNQYLYDLLLEPEDAQ